VSANSSIEWTDRTWNPVRGCSVISPGCVNCYAMKQAHRFSGPGRAYDGLTKLTKAGPQWTGIIRTVESALLEPLSWRKPQRVFVNSMSDLFHEGVPFEFVDKVFATMAQSWRHTFQILTKRADRMREYIATPGRKYRVDERTPPAPVGEWPWPLPNVWLGVSVEDQKHADERIPQLLQTPAAVRFISAEPLLGPVNVEPYVRNTRTIHVSVDVEGALANRSFGFFTENGRTLSAREAEERLKILRFQGVRRISAANGECVGFSDQTGCPGHQHPRLDWLIVGGESGHGARVCSQLWIRSIVQQCRSASVPVFVKQIGKMSAFGEPSVNGGFRPKDGKGGDPAEWETDLRVRQFPEPVHA
jgi:protein gp37